MNVGRMNLIRKQTMHKAHTPSLSRLRNGRRFRTKPISRIATRGKLIGPIIVRRDVASISLAVRIVDAPARNSDAPAFHTRNHGACAHVHERYASRMRIANADREIITESRPTWKISELKICFRAKIVSEFQRLRHFR